MGFHLVNPLTSRRPTGSSMDAFLFFFFFCMLIWEPGFFTFAKYGVIEN